MLSEPGGFLKLQLELQNSLLEMRVSSPILVPELQEMWVSGQTKLLEKTKHDF